jgi:hypothetical protein
LSGNLWQPVRIFSNSDQDDNQGVHIILLATTIAKIFPSFSGNISVIPQIGALKGLK